MPGFPYRTVCEIAFTSPFAAPTFTDVTDRLMGFSTRVGGGYNWDGPQPGNCTVTLDNSDGALDPLNTGSPYYPNMRVNRIVRLTAYRTAADFPGNPKYLSYCYVDSWQRSFPGGGRQSDTVLACTDLVKYLNRWTATATVATGNVNNHISGIVPGTSTPGTGGNTMDSTNYSGLNQWTAVQNTAIADGGLFFIAGDGTPTYQSYGYRINNTRSLNVQETFAFGIPSGTELVDDVVFLLDDQLIANNVTVYDSAGNPHTLADASSQAEYGDLTFTIGSASSSPSQNSSRLSGASANTRRSDLINQRANPKSRIDSLTIDALTGDQQLIDALTLQMGDRVRLLLRGLGDAAQSTSDLWVRGISHDVDFVNPKWLTTYDVVGVY